MKNGQKRLFIVQCAKIWVKRKRKKAFEFFWFSCFAFKFLTYFFQVRNMSSILIMDEIPYMLNLGKILYIYFCALNFEFLSFSGFSEFFVFFFSFSCFETTVLPYKERFVQLKYFPCTMLAGPNFFLLKDLSQISSFSKTVINKEGRFSILVIWLFKISASKNLDVERATQLVKLNVHIHIQEVRHETHELIS